MEINNKKWINTLIFNTHVEHYKHLQLMWLNKDDNKEKLDEAVKKLIKINNERK